MVDAGQLRYGYRRLYVQGRTVYVYGLHVPFVSGESFERTLRRKTRQGTAKTHNLLYLIEKMKLKLPEDLHDFTSTLNRVSVPTRYPDDLRRILKDYDKKKTREVLDQSKKVLQWLSAR